MELSKHLTWGTYSAVHVPTSEDEAVKNYTRLRNTRKESLKKAKQNLLSFLLRMGCAFSEGKNYWTTIHYAWLKRQHFTDPVNQETFNEYLQEVNDQQEKVDRYNQKIEELSQLETYRKKVERLRCFRGHRDPYGAVAGLRDWGFLPVRQRSAILRLSGLGTGRGLKRPAGETGRHHKSWEHPIEAAAHRRGERNAAKQPVWTEIEEIESKAIRKRPGCHCLRRQGKPEATPGVQQSYQPRCDQEQGDGCRGKGTFLLHLGHDEQQD